MAKLTLNNISGGYLPPVVVNANNDAIETALENTLSRDGTTPNAMGASLDMNSNRIINLPAPSAATDAARLVDLQGTIVDASATAQLRIDLGASTGTTLVDTIASGVGAVARTVQSKLREYPRSPNDYATGAVSPTQTDLVESITAAGTGGTIQIPDNTTIAVTSTVSLLANQKLIFGKNSKLTAASQIVVLNMSAAGCEVWYPEIQGPGLGAAIGTGVGIHISGTFNGAGVAPTYTSGQKIVQPKIHAFDRSGIEVFAAKDGFIESPEIYSCFLAGIDAESVTRFNGTGIGYIHDIGPATGDTANGIYGFTYTRRTDGVYTNDEVAAPRSQDCSVVPGWHYENIQSWEAVDTHAGKNIHFGKSIIRNCRSAGNIGGDGHVLGPINCSMDVEATNEVADQAYIANTDPARAMSGLNCGGVAAQQALNCSLRGTLTRFGGDATINGGVLLIRTDNVVVDVVCIQPRRSGIVVYHDNHNFRVRATVDDCGSDLSATEPSGVSITANNNNTGIVEYVAAANTAANPFANVGQQVVYLGANNTAVTIGKTNPIGTWTYNILDSSPGAKNFGTYTPTVTDVANVAAHTVYDCYFSHSDGFTHVTGQIAIDPTAATDTKVGISLPTLAAADLTTAYQLSGSAICPALAGTCAAIVGDATNNRAEIQFVAVDVANRLWSFSFKYYSPRV